MTPDLLLELARQSKSTTWADPALHPVAIASLDRVTIGRFALDHDNKTARLIATGCQEIRNTGQWIGMPAEVEGWEHGPLHPQCLAGLTLTLMDWPLRGQVYTIIGEMDGRK